MQAKKNKYLLQQKHEVQIGLLHTLFPEPSSFGSAHGFNESNDVSKDVVCMHNMFVHLNQNLWLERQLQAIDWDQCSVKQHFKKM